MDRTRKTIATLLTAGLIGMAATFASASLAASSGPKILKVWLSPTGADTNAWGRAKYIYTKKTSRLKVMTHNLAAGAYNVEVGGVVVGSFDVSVDPSTGNKVGRCVIDSRRAGGASIDPRGASLAVVSQATGMLMLGTDRFPVSRLENTERTEIEVPFVNTGVQPSAEGEAKFKEYQGRQKFKVELEGLAGGTYDLIVGGAVQGQLLVDQEGEAEIGFDSVPEGSSDDDQGEDDQGDDDQGEDVAADQNQEDGDGDLLLTFDPRGQEILVSQGGVTVLQIAAFPMN